jgi:chitodextrinase
LTASSTTSTATTLNWGGSTAIAGCSITFPVYQNGALIATTGSPNYKVTGLSAATTYTFAVAAGDSYGVSAQSPAINVTTLSSGGTQPGTYTITVTGTSGSLSHSTQVTLIVD